MPVFMRFTRGTRKKKPTTPKNSLAELTNSLSSSIKKKIASLTRKRRTRLLKSLVKNFKTKQETKKKVKKAATTIQERARAKIKGKKTRKQIKENYEIDNQCAICLETMKDNGLTTKTKCGHKFHSECIDRWLTDYKNDTCPTCREILVERDTDDEGEDDEEDEEEEEEEEEDPWLEARARGRGRATESINLIRSNYAAALSNLESIDDSRFAMAWRQAALSALRDVRMTIQVLQSQQQSAWEAVHDARSIAVDRGLRPLEAQWAALEGRLAAYEADIAYYRYREWAMAMMEDLLDFTFTYQEVESVTTGWRTEQLFNAYLGGLRRFDLRQEVRESAMRMAVPYVDHHLPSVVRAAAREARSRQHHLVR